MLRAYCGPLLCLVAVGFSTVGSARTPTSPYETKLLNEQVNVSSQGFATDTVHIQVKANNAAAAQKIGQQPILYSEALNNLEIVEAFTFKADGTRIPVADSAIYTQLPQGAPQMPMFSDLKQKVVVFPDVEAGDTIDLTFRRVDKQPQIPGQFTFERAYTRLASFDDVDVTIHAPKSYPLVTEAHDVQFDRHDNGTETIYHWHYASPATLESDSSTFSPFDRSPRLLASSLKDYDAFAHVLSGLVVPEEKVTPKIQALADQLTARVSDRKQQAERLYEWVSGHIRYVAVEIGTGSIVPHAADLVLANGYGDCKDHVVLYAALLKAKGIASDFAVINLGNAYTLPGTAVLGELNHVITWLPEFGIYADTTAAVAPFGTLPLQEYGKPVVHAIAAGSNALRRVPILSPGLATLATSTIAKIEPSGAVTGSSTITASGPFSLLLRQVGLGIETVGADAAAQAVLKATNTEGTATFSLPTPPNDLAPTYRLQSTWSFGPYPWVTQGQRFSMPVGLAVLGLPGDLLVGSLLRTKVTDSEPIPCFSGRAVEDVSLEAPPGRHFLPPPQDAIVRSAHISFNTRWTLVGDTLHLHREFTSTVDTAICSGATRSEIANALVAIRQTYNYGAALAPESTGKPMASLDSAQLAEASSAITDLPGVRDRATRAASSSDVPENLVATLSGSQSVAPVSSSDKSKGDGGIPGAIAVASLENRSPLASMAQVGATGAGESALLYDRRGIAKIDLGHFDAAAADFSKAISLAKESNTASQYYADRALSFWFAQDWRPALRDYSAAIARDDNNADAYLGRGRSEYFAGRLKESIADFRKALEVRNDPYAALWLFIAESRTGRNPRADIGARTARWDLGAWPGPLLHVFRGDALAPPQEPADKHERCAQEFYLGELALLGGDHSKAVTHFRAARDTTLATQVEFVAAGLELARLVH